MSAPRAELKLDKDNVRKILEWKNNCPSACVADFLVEGLESRDAITDTTADVLGQMVGDYYGTRKLSRKELTTLFSAPYCFTPYDWQVILGAIFREYIEAECKAHATEYAGVVDKVKQMTPKAFAILADKLKVNVDFYVQEAGTTNIQSVRSVIAKIPGADTMPQYKELQTIDDHKGSSVKVYCKPNHYDRLIEDAGRAQKLNSLDDAVSFSATGDYVFSTPSKPKFTPVLVSVYRDSPDALKSAVKAKILEVQNPANTVVSSPWHAVTYKMDNLLPYSKKPGEVKSDSTSDVKSSAAPKTSPKAVALPPAPVTVAEKVKVPARFSTITKLLADDKLAKYSKEFQEAYRAVKEADADEKKAVVAQQKLEELNNVYETKHQTFRKEVVDLKLAAEDTKWTSLVVEVENRISDAKAGVATIAYDKTGHKSFDKFDMFVTKADQLKLDEQLARKLQQEELERLKFKK